MVGDAGYLHTYIPRSLTLAWIRVAENVFVFISHSLQSFIMFTRFVNANNMGW